MLFMFKYQTTLVDVHSTALYYPSTRKVRMLATQLDRNGDDQYTLDAIRHELRRLDIPCSVSLIGQTCFLLISRGHL